VSRRVFSENERRDIVARYRSGDTKGPIARAYHVSARAISAVLREERIEERGQFALSPSDQKTVIDAYQQGALQKDLAARFSVTVQTIRNMLKRHVVARESYERKFRRFTPEEIDMMRTMSAEGASQNHIAVTLGTKQVAISRAMHRHDIAPAKSGPLRGKDHGSWRGGRHINDDGYVLIRIDRDDPYASMALVTGYVAEHRLVMAHHLGRLLTPAESVHHINGNRADNRLENLQIREGRHGNGQVWRCRNCGSHNIEASSISAVD